MESNHMTKSSILHPENIDHHHFTLSLLKEARRAEILTVPQAEQLQVNLMVLLSQTILHYTRNESSSVKAEVAEGILQSILYNMDVYLMRRPSLEEAVTSLLNMPPPALFDQGHELVKQDVLLAKQLLKEVQESKLPVSLIAYKDTIDKSIGVFLKNYDAQFAAYDTSASIDYPLLSDDMQWTGIIYIKRYLEHLKLENELCSHFPPGTVNRLLEGCGQKYRMDYREILLNIPDLILKNALCKILIGKPFTSLLISKKECALLEKQLQNATDTQLPILLKNATDILFMQINCTEPALKLYVQPFIDMFCTLLSNSVSEHGLADLLILENDMYFSQPNVPQYMAGRKLSDEQLQAVIERMQECKDGKAKADLIQSAVHHMEDLIDILSAYCIFDEEYIALFDRMSDHELAILCTDLIDHSPLAKSQTLCVDPWHSSENEIYWQKILIQYLEDGEPDRYKNIVRLAAGMEEMTKV